MKKMFAVFFALSLCLALMVPAFAAASEPTEGSEGVREGEPEVLPPNPGGVEGPSVLTEHELEDEMDKLQEGIPNVSVDDMSNYLEHKGNDIVHVLQTVGKYVCVAAFIICCFLALIGLIGNKRMFTGALIGLLISGVAYAGIVLGPEIVKWIANWAATK